jgi:ABC-type multidrug transport system permease subunit
LHAVLYGSYREYHPPGATAARAALHGFAKGIAAKVGTEQVSSRATMSMRMAPRMASANRADIAKIIEESLPAMSSIGQAPTEDLIAFDIQKVGEVEAKNPSNFVIPRYLVMFVFFLAAMGAEAIVRERQNQTLERLLASCVRREAILGGIFIGTALRGIVQIILFWSVGVLIFRLGMGTSPAAVILMSTLMVLVSSTFSLMLATLVRTQRAAIAIGGSYFIDPGPLDGCWWPLFMHPNGCNSAPVPAGIHLAIVSAFASSGSASPNSSVSW